MTATLDRPAATVTPEPTVERGTRLRRRVAGATLLGAAAVSLAGFLATPWEDGSKTSDYLESLAAHPKQAMIAATLLHFGYLLFVPAAFAMARLARRGAPVLSGIGITLSVLGAGLSGLLVTDAYDLSIARHVGTTAGVPTSEMKDVPGALLAQLTMGAMTALGAILGLVVLAVAMRRARLAPLWPALAVFGGFFSAFGAHSAVRSCTGFAVTAVGLAFLGITVLRMSDERFAHGSDAR